jgi:hypothetical protein
MTSIDDEFDELTSLIRRRPLLARLVDKESQRVVNEFSLDGMTGPEIENWLGYLKRTCGPNYEIEIPNQSTTEERTP